MEEIGTANAIIYKVLTTLDGGARVSFDFGQNDSELIAKLLELKMRGDAVVTLGIVGQG